MKLSLAGPAAVNITRRQAVLPMTMSLVLATGAAYTALAVIIVYCIWRVAASDRKLTPRAETPSQNPSVWSFFETLRSVRMHEAAQLESAIVHAREAAREPYDKGIVYLTRDSDLLWWTDKFGVSTDVLKAAMREVGPMSKDIERHLASQGRDREALPV